MRTKRSQLSGKKNKKLRNLLHPIQRVSRFTPEILKQIGLWKEKIF